MAIDLVTSASFVPASELLSQIIEAILEITTTANNVLFKKESFKQLAAYLERIVPVLKELKRKEGGNSESLNNAIEILNREVKATKELTLECTKRNKVYLLMKCRGIDKRLQDASRDISQALSLLPLTSLELSSNIIEDIAQVQGNMQTAEFRAAVAEEQILEKIESGIQEENINRSYANNLMVLIAEAVGIPNERSVLRKEIEDFKSEIENARLRKDLAEAIQMDQIISLLERADAASSPKGREIKYLTKRSSLGSQPLEPLQSFYCPITGDVMVDPVETSSGQTFERCAISKWFAEGNNICPLTATPLDRSVLRPNKTLRQSIEEWKDRNTMITIASMKSKLMFEEEEEEVLHCLKQLKELCEQSDVHQEWVILENYIPVLLQLLASKNHDLRTCVLAILHNFAKDGDDAKERIAKVDNAISSIVRSLGRRVEERRLAVVLLLELSKYELLRNCIGKVRGCILLLVTMSSDDDNQSARDAEELLENLSFSDQNIIQMARANYFKHLLQRLSTGSEDVKMTMVTALAEMVLTDHNKVVLLEGGVLAPLLHLVSHGDIQMKMVTVSALQNLSSLPRNGLQMIREGAVGPLLDVLFHHSSSTPRLREQVAATIMHLALSTVLQECDRTPVRLLESEEDIFKLFSLINVTGPDVQQNILQIFQALCQCPSATDIKIKLAQCSAIQILLQLCKHNDKKVRPNVVKLLFFLVNDGDEATILEHVEQKCIESLLTIIQTSDDEEEVTSAMGIISNLPENPLITKWLLDTGGIPTIFSFLQRGRCNDPHKVQLVENAVGAIRHFIAPTKLEWQKKAAEADIIPVLVHLLDYGTALTKKFAAISLCRFSKSSPKLSRSVSKHKGFWCLSAPPETTCPIHGGICSMESSFCLVEADAVRPLVRVLEESDPEVCEASLDALLTLIEDEGLQSGSKVLEQANAIPPMIKFLGSTSVRLQEKTLSALERIFRLPEFKQKYGPSAQTTLVDLTQLGNSSMKSLAAKILAHLNVLHNQSTFF
ncbi:hypothetical protein SLEP1_g2218 [Rubroshorea leprosula]|uniref:RING-type E3 ubiquitin transferase n=1 Tax=Rubroshorea leprosula TaxID=152421 RepID=A0AAV5HPQ6_9ROSI|nr:hypothetical protein SLEP1_g2218 [Rubroshorea leprosula]